MRKGKYLIERIDGFEWLKKRRALSIHAVVTDPPYGIVEYSPEQLKKRLNGKGIWRLPHAFDGRPRMCLPRFTVLTNSDHAAIKNFHERLAAALIRVLVPGAHVIIASNTILAHLVTHSFVGAGFEVRGQIARVVKTLRGGDRPKGAHLDFPNVSVTPRSCWEPWLIFRKPLEGLVRENLLKWQTGALKRASTGIPFSDLVFSGPARGVERQTATHPSLKPQSFMRTVVGAALPLGKGVILDPFMGSGSTIAAASALGLRSIGLEINTQYFREAHRVISKLIDIEI